MVPRLILSVVLVTALPALELSAQAPVPADAAPQAPAQFDAPAYVAVVDGGATLERDGRVETAPLNMPVLTGDRLRTTDGRLEVRFADGGRLQLDTRTSVDVLSDDLVRLADGRIRVSVVRAAQQVAYRVDSPAGSARIIQSGEYRIAVLHGAAASGAQETQLELAVVSGSAEIFTDQGATPLRSGERAYASAGLMPSYAYTFNAATADDFDRWSEMQRGSVYAGTSESAQYLPQEMTNYAPTFDQYGAWQYQQDYGYVWYPRVAADWHPYYYGRWASYPSYGWTWIAADPFGYPTHHYGRWGVNAGVWFWIPSAHWGPAYVSWGFAADYVSWCPLGWNNRAVFSIGFYNAGPAYYSSHYHGHYYAAWTTVPRGSFGHGYAQQHAVNWDRGYTGARPHFTEGRTPAGASSAMARGSAAAPVRYAGTRANVSRVAPAVRSETPRYINHGDQIIRSQTGQPIAPSRPARTESAPGGMNRENAVPRYNAPAYSAPTYNAPSYTAPRGYERATPRAQGVPGGVERSQAPQAQPYQGGVPQYQAPRYQPRQYQAPPQSQAPQSRGGEMRPAPQYQPPSRGYERPAERAAPPSRPSGGDHAAPRAGGGGQAETRAPGAASRSHRGSR